MIRKVIQHQASSVAVVDRYQPTMDGTVIVADNDVANAMILKVDQGPHFNYTSALKTVNIYKLSQPDMRDLVIPSLTRCVEEECTDQYYEVIFSDLIAQNRLRMAVLGMDSMKWAEVDTMEDLSVAEKLFGGVSSHTADSAGLPALSR